MCGIVGYVGRRDAAPILLEGLRRLEYRGYDSAGIGVVRDGRLRIGKRAGRVGQLREALPADLNGNVGIAHTRWATHGAPTDRNAHPHTDAAGDVAIVHNGVLENADELRARLLHEGVDLVSDTDSELLAHLIARAGHGLADAVRAALDEVEGTVGLIAVDRRRPDTLVAARRGSPLVLGIGAGEVLIASDVAAFVRHTQQVVYLDEDEIAVVSPDDYRTFAPGAAPTTRAPVRVAAETGSYELGDHPDFMHKEIREQPAAIARVLAGRLDERAATTRLDGLGLEPRHWQRVRRVTFLGCGSAYYAAEYGAQLVEDLARIPARAEPSSEYRYRNAVVDPDALYVAVSQSGETLDTLAAIRELKRRGAPVVGAVNVVGSSIANECDGGIFLHAGPEQSVAATKSFTNMGLAFALLAVQLGRLRDLSLAQGARLLSGLRRFPDEVEAALKTDDQITELAARFRDCSHMFFVGRVRGWPIAREGAQKLKEVSYVHAEAYPAAELKHGPLALVTPAMPTIAVVPDDELLPKNLATLTEIRSRGGPVVAVTNADLPPDAADEVVRVGRCEPELDPLVLSVPLQLFAYRMARALGREVDRPRNLAKSVTVE
ncbi:glutamine--fructose-6-phosphate transaminase (isomerizing) [Amycolatopsis acidicola]|uniref:Glutamine--fructose-6-phosphate aminotransferase [isomerizing] n=1 Tax=Amycolatopsis acidicola TaxID=2596893 RepID=A0A5N0UQK8_9PSEU|nr:glutamine--fructose-6-phosphate transaminase (isomerizing) [Amycolatopsis acidicola]KAA9153604.1 glutamine--fructose-6-phosphate transaminase (isomerizing) [Amycolatopsis acidicola]